MASRNAESHPAGGPTTHPLIERVPLTLRRVACYLACILFIIALLPYLADQLARQFLPASWHFEIGWAGRAVGAIIFLTCLVLYTTSSITLMRHGRGAYIEFDPPKEFVAVGPFRWCRNPIAACVLGMVAGEALAFSSTGIALFFLLGLPLAQAQVVLLEEPLLEKRFGQTYRDYRARVPRWIPRPPRKESS